MRRAVRSVGVISFLAAGIVAAGCMRHPRPAPATRPTTVPVRRPAPLSPAELSSQLQAELQALQAETQRLPGATEAEHRQLMAGSLDHIHRAMALLGRGIESGEFRQELRIVSSSQQQLASAPAGLSAEPFIDTALRAAYQGLALINNQRFAGNADIKKLLDLVPPRLEQLDMLRGPDHWLVASGVVSMMQQVLERMEQVVRP